MDTWGIVLLVLAAILVGLLAALPYTMPRRLLAQRVIVGLLMAVIFAGALFLRINYSHDVVFGGPWVKFTGVDVYWHIRNVDSLSHNFPFMSSVDPYLLYPGGSGTSLNNPFFDYLLGFIVWVAGAGSPTQNTVDTIAPYFAPVLGALTIIPAYFLGRALAGRWAGIFAAGLVAILPGEFLGRSILGFTDHHVMETLLSATTVMFLVLALKNARKERITPTELRHPRTGGTAKPLACGALCGLFLGLFLASWEGALLFVFIIAAFFVLQSIIDHVREVPTDYLGLVGVTVFLVALVVFLLLGQGGDTWAVLLMAVFVPAALFGLSRLISWGRLSPFVYPAVVVLLGLGAFGLLLLVDRSLVDALLEHFTIFRWNLQTTVSEQIPFLYDRSSAGGLDFSFGPLWNVFGWGLVFALAGIGFVIYAVVRRWEAEKIFMLWWTGVMLLATFAQRRFAYYLVVNVALLAGYAAWYVLSLAGMEEADKAPDEETEGSRGPEGRRKGQRSKGKKASAPPSFRPARRQLYLTAAALGIYLFFSLVPYTSVDLEGAGQKRLVNTLQYAKKTASLTPDNPRYAPPDAWCESLTWLRNNTPEPFESADYYYARYETPTDYSAFPNAYGVMAWWDYGYWVARIGHRPPVQNPGGGLPSVAEFFLAQDEAAGSKVMDAHGARYVILDYQFTTGKMHGAVYLTGRSEQEYYDYFLYPVSNGAGGTTLQARKFFFPEYYRTMTLRLYAFGGQAVTPGAGDVLVLGWKWQTLEGGEWRMVTESQKFDSFEVAQAFIDSKSSGNYDIVGVDPFTSPVPLEKLEGYTLCHESEVKMTWSSQGDTIPQIRIFEYSG